MIMSSVRRGAVALCVLLIPVSAQAETLGDALKSAYEHSGLLEQNRALLRAADEDVAQAISALRPVIGWAVTAQRQFGEQATARGPGVQKFGETDLVFALTAELLVWDAGRTRLGVDAAKEAVLAAREQLRNVEQSVLLRAATAYISVLNGIETVQLRENNVRLLEEELRAANDRFEVGEVTRTDVALAEARRASALANLAGARGQLDQARGEYVNAVGRPPSGLQRITQLPRVERDEATAIRIALRQAPALLSAQREVTIATINVERARLAMAGTASLSGEWGYRERLTDQDENDRDEFSNTGTVSLSFRQPIYQGGRLLSAQRQAIAQRDASLGNVHVVQHNVQQDVSNAVALLRIADAGISATREQIRAAEVAFNGVREEAQLGQRTTLDVLTAEQDLLDARTQLANAIADRDTTVFQLLAATGLMTADYLGLDVQQYDPNAYYQLIERAPAASIQGDRLNRVLQGIGRN